MIRQLFEDPAESYQVSRTSCRQTRTPVEEMVPVMYPGNGMSCNGSSPLEMGIGFYKIRGYRYEQEPFTETITVGGREPSLLERAGRVAMEGIGEAVFGGLLPETVRRNDAALGAVSGSVLGKSESTAGKLRNTKNIRYSQDSIKGTFDDGTNINELVYHLKNSPEYASAVEPIRLVKYNDLPSEVQQYLGKQGVSSSAVFTLDNRRLYVAKQARVNVNSAWATQADLASIDLIRRFTTKNAGKMIKIR